MMDARLTVRFIFYYDFRSPKTTTVYTDGVDDGCGVFFGTEGVGLLACDESRLSALTTDALLLKQCVRIHYDESWRSQNMTAVSQ